MRGSPSLPFSLPLPFLTAAFTQTLCWDLFAGHAFFLLRQATGSGKTGQATVPMSHFLDILHTCFLSYLPLCEHLFCVCSHCLSIATAYLACYCPASHLPACPFLPATHCCCPTYMDREDAALLLLHHPSVWWVLPWDRDNSYTPHTAAHLHAFARQATWLKHFAPPHMPAITHTHFILPARTLYCTFSKSGQDKLVKTSLPAYLTHQQPSSQT